MHKALTILLALLIVGCRHTDKPQTAAPTTQPASRPAPLLDPRETLLSDIQQLTFGFSRAGEAYFHPTAPVIIFQAVPKGESHYQMYVMPRTLFGKVGPPVRISPANSRNTCGYFSPDGKSILFGTTAGKEVPDDPRGGYQREGRSYVWAFPKGMEIVRFDGWANCVEQVLQTGWKYDIANLRTSPTGQVSFDNVLFTFDKPPAPPDPAQLKPLTNNDVYDAEAAYSPDGKWICYTHGAGKDADIYVMRSDGTNPVRITNAAGYAGGPFFSPDGRRLVYRSDRKGNDLLQIFTCELAFDDQGNITGAKSEKQLTDDNNVNWGPYWHPGGKHIVYATSIHGHQNYELYLMGDDGSKPTRITWREGADVLPVFSPDGKYLMWTSKRSPDGTTQVFVARFTLPK